MTSLLLLSLLPAYADAPLETVSGHVILDANRNGKRDPGEKGVAGVAVTDGVRIVVTNGEGAYTLAIGNDPLIPFRPVRTISVCWPSGMWPVAQQWCRLFRELKPGQAVDFFLREDKQALPFSFAHATDPHNNFVGAEDFRDEIQRQADDVRFCIFTGDLGYMGRDNADKDFTSIRDYTHKFPVPMLHTPGNHDIVGIHSTAWSAQDALAGYGPYTRYLGPIRWSFTYAGVHFVGLDWARILDDGKLETGTPDMAIAWLEQDLKLQKPGTRTLVFMHHHHRTDEKFWDVLVKYKVELLLAGHSHRNLDQSRRGVEALTTMNLRGPYRLVNVGEKGHAIVNRCYGCKSYGGTYHSKHCKLFVGAGAAQNKNAIFKSWKDREVSKDEVIAEKLRGQELEIVAEFEPGTARRFGLRLADGKGAVLDVTCSADGVQVGEARTSAVGARGQSGYTLRVTVDKGMARVMLNSRVQIERAFVATDVCTLTLFAEEGKAGFKKVEVWDVGKGP